MLVKRIQPKQPKQQKPKQQAQQQQQQESTLGRIAKRVETLWEAAKIVAPAIGACVAAASRLYEKGYIGSESNNRDSDWTQQKKVIQSKIDLCAHELQQFFLLCTDSSLSSA